MLRLGRKESSYRFNKVYLGITGVMENATSHKVTINNPADITIIVGYFAMVIGVGIWVSAPVFI